MTINELYDHVYSNTDTKKPDIFIKTFEDNLAIIENQEIHADNEIYNAVMRLTADYAHNLRIKEAYTKALPYLDRAIDLFENFPDFDNTKMNDVDFYRTLRFDRGISNYYKNHFSKSEKDFHWLVKHNPDNDIYKNWVFALHYRKYDLTIKILWYIVIGSVVFSALASRLNYNFINSLILCSGAIALIISIILEIIRYINKRKQNAA
jgi:hypothetical protein